ncbi:MAG: hypothetical protein OEW59_02785 [Gammaproteobacteria bacterium]|nr:hypothetical protein [Gammaproteobacteria bacterium]
MVMSQPSHNKKGSDVWRPFGRPEDLDVDFMRDDRPALVTALLASCGESRDDGFWWLQPVGSRIAALLRLLAATDAVDHLSLLAHCRRPSCGERFEFELPLAMLHDVVPEGETIQVPLNGGRSVLLRRPNGRDLREWRSQQPTSRQAAVATMLRSLVVEGQATPDDEPVLAEALLDLDPLVAFTVSCACPACRSINEVRVDLEDIALARLRWKQRELLHDIHRLASRYGWTEAEVLAIPPHRRTHYLAMIEDER